MGVVGLFPGQGSQSVGMAEKVKDKSYKLFERASSILGRDLLDLIESGPSQELTLTKWAQPAILTVSYAYWLNFHTQENYVCFLGHSLGELTALLVSGVFDFETAVYLAHKRGEYMQEAVPEGLGGMTAFLTDSVQEIVEWASQFNVYIANYNSPTQIVIAGLLEDLNRFEEFVSKQTRVKCIRLQVSAPFHTPLMEPARLKFSALLDGIKISSPTVPVISNGYVKEYPKDVSMLKSFLSDQIVQPVRFLECLKYSVEHFGCKQFDEIGFGTILTGLAKKSGLPLQKFEC